METALENFTAFADKHNLYFSIADHYGEPGYVDTDNGIILSDWNDVPDNLQAHLEEAGYSLEWYDEWVVTDDSPSYAYRSSPDSYGWMPSYFTTENSVIGRHELFDVVDDREVPDFNCSAVDEYIDYLKVDRDNIDHYLAVGGLHADTFSVDFSKVGFKPLGSGDEPAEYETGFHPGQTDDPAEVLKGLEDEVHNGLEVIFVIDSVGQFDCRWKVLVRQSEN